MLFNNIISIDIQFFNDQSITEKVKSSILIILHQQN